MHGLMMEQPLLVSSLLRHAERYHGTTAVVSCAADGHLTRSNWATVGQRARRLATALGRLGVIQGDRVATLGWNHLRHLEAYYAISGMGAVCHTLNPRLFLPQLAHIVGAAQDVGVLADRSCLPLIEGLAELGVRFDWVIVMDDSLRDQDRRGDQPGSSGQGLNLLDYDALLDGAGEDDWPVLDEGDAAALCFTSGTSGLPKGVLYSHRSTVLHAWAVALPDSLGFSARDRVLPVVPLFHANAWGFPYAAALTGAALILPGPRLDGESLYRLLESERVTITAGVPTVWQGLRRHLETQGLQLHHLQRLGVGGAACPRPLLAYFETVQKVTVLPGWGMTETSPVAALTVPKAAQAELWGEDRLDWLGRSGRPPFGVEFELRDENGGRVAPDGQTPGHLRVRGPWVCRGYLGEAREALEDGWLPTGDVATLDEEGFITITDRAKDMIKSGGEWISSVTLEQAAALHPTIEEAAALALPDPQWGERPGLLVVLRLGAALDVPALQAHLATRVAKWWIPDHIEAVSSLPRTATGKLDKLTLRRERGL